MVTSIPPAADKLIVNKLLIERTLSCINENFKNNYVMFRSYSEDFFEPTKKPNKLRGERYPSQFFNLNYLTQLGIPYHPGLMFSSLDMQSPNGEPTMGWYYPEWADIIFSVMTSHRKDSYHTEAALKNIDEQLKIVIDLFKKSQTLQIKLIDLNRKEGLVASAIFIQELFSEMVF